MKKLLLPLLVALPLWAAGFDGAKRLYDDKRYEQAYDAFRSLFRSDMGNAEINLFLARSALETRRYNEAIAAYERVLMLRPGNAVARFELGRAYYAAGLYDQAEGEFAAVLAQPMPQELRQSVLQYLAAISQAKQKHNVSLFVSAGLLDDSNIRYDSDNRLGGLTNAALSGRAHFEQLAFTHIYNLPEKDRFWQTRVNLYNQQFFELSGSEWTSESPRLLGGSEQDLTFPSVETGWLYRGRDYSLFVPLGFSMLKYGGTSYFRDLSLGAQYEKPLSRTDTMALDFRLTDRLSLLNPPRDSRLLYLKGDLRRSDDSGGMWIYSGYLQQEDYVEKEFIDITTLSIGAQRIIGLERGWSALLGASLKHRGEAEKSFEDKKRSDISLDLTASVNMPLEKTSYLSLSAGYGKGDSNNDFFDYERRVFTVSYNHFFGDSAIKRIKE